MDEIQEDELRKYVRQFLEEFKSLIFENGIQVTDRQINKLHLLELVLTAKQREEIVLSLSVLYYNSSLDKTAFNPTCGGVSLL